MSVTKFRKRSLCFEFMSSTVHEIRHFHTVVMQCMSKKCTKKLDAHAEVLFCLSRPNAFLSFLLTSSCLCLSFLTNGSKGVVKFYNY